MFFSERESTRYNHLTEPIGLKRLLLIRQLMGFISTWFYKFGKQNGFESVTEDRERLTVFVASPIEMMELLKSFKDATPEEQNAIISYFKRNSPSAWTTLNAFPDHKAESLDNMFDKMYKAKRDITENAYRDPEKKNILSQSPLYEPPITSSPCETGFDINRQRPMDESL